MEKTNNINGAQSEIRSGVAFNWTIFSIITFFGMFMSFGFLDKADSVKYLVALLAVTSHLSLIPAIVTLKSASWAKVGGYTWVVTDIILSVATLNGADENIIKPLRLGMHSAIAIWPLGVGLASTGFIRYSGFALAISIGVVPLLGKLVPPELMFIAAPFIFIYLIATALEFKRLAKSEPTN